jgi:hypothetical protein
MTELDSTVTEVEQSTAIESEPSPVEPEQSSGAASHEKKAGWLLVAVGGVIGAVALIKRDRRSIGGLLIAGCVIAGGVVLLTRERRARIHTATQRIEEELDALDPLARAQVVKAVAEHEMDQFKS